MDSPVIGQLDNSATELGNTLSRLQGEGRDYRSTENFPRVILSSASYHPDIFDVFFLDPPNRCFVSTSLP